jgi:hypothetical protein
MLQSLESREEINDVIDNRNKYIKKEDTCFGLKRMPASTALKTFFVLRNSVGNVRAMT